MMFGMAAWNEISELPRSAWPFGLADDGAVSPPYDLAPFDR